MLFSVVIPTYNRAALLRETLESVWKQSSGDCEVIVVDDGSTDDTPGVVAEYGERVRFLRQPNSGPGTARNLGVAHAAGDYVAFLDSDDLWFPWTLATYAALIRERKPAFVAGKPFVFEGGAALPAAPGAEPAANEFADYFASSDEWRWWGVSSFVVRRDVLRATGGFLTGHINGEDADLAMQLGVAPGFVQVVRPATFAYRQHADTLVADPARSLAGLWHLIDAEKAGRYPGGDARCDERREIVTRYMRPIALQCLRNGQLAQARDLYRATFGWHLRLRRWKFLATFPVLAAAAPLRRGARSREH